MHKVIYVPSLGTCSNFLLISFNFVLFSHVFRDKGLEVLISTIPVLLLLPLPHVVSFIFYNSLTETLQNF
jgi:hypothetical protein